MFTSDSVFIFRKKSTRGVALRYCMLMDLFLSKEMWRYSFKCTGVALHLRTCSYRKHFLVIVSIVSLIAAGANNYYRLRHSGSSTEFFAFSFILYKCSFVFRCIRGKDSVGVISEMFTFLQCSASLKDLRSSTPQSLKVVKYHLSPVCRILND